MVYYKIFFQNVKFLNSGMKIKNCQNKTSYFIWKEYGDSLTIMLYGEKWPFLKNHHIKTVIFCSKKPLINQNYFDESEIKQNTNLALLSWILNLAWTFSIPFIQ